MGNKDTKEAAVAAVALGKALTASAKKNGGVNLAALIEVGRALTTDAQFRQTVLEGIEGIGNIQGEIKAFTPQDYAEIGLAVVTELQTKSSAQ